MEGEEKNSVVIQDLDMNAIDTVENIKNVKNFLIEALGEENIKIKPADGQMIIRNSNYHYKFVITSLRNKIQVLIRQFLAEIYREEYGLHWVVHEKLYNDGLSIMQIIEKETVTVCEDKTETELADALGELTYKLEQKFNGFDFIYKKLKQHMPNFMDYYKVKLVKLSKIKNSDYGITKDGKIILLDDSDWYFVIYDQKSDNLVVTCLPVFIVDFQGEEYFFTSIHDMDDFDSVITGVYAQKYRFNLIKVNQFLDPRDIQHHLEDKVLLYYNDLTHHICKEHMQLENKAEDIKRIKHEE